MKCSSIRAFFSIVAIRDLELEYMSRVEYSSAAGSLMYAIVCSHPNLSYAMSLVSRYMTNHNKGH
jgi:ATP-binding cassette subfamily B (MDR/TAP) protein 1